MMSPYNSEVAEAQFNISFNLCIKTNKTLEDFFSKFFSLSKVNANDLDMPISYNVVAVSFETVLY